MWISIYVTISSSKARAEGCDKLLTFLVMRGQGHEATAFEPLLEAGAVERAARGRPRLRPECVVAVKGYRSNRNYLNNKASRRLSGCGATTVETSASTGKHTGSGIKSGVS